MIGIDVKPLETRLQTTFAALEAKLGADGISAASISAEKKQHQDAVKPLYEVRSKVSTLLGAARSLSFPGMTDQQQELARAALTAAEALDKSTAMVFEDSKTYTAAAELCDALLQLCVGVEKAFKGYQSSYTWESPETRFSSSEHTATQVQRVTTLLQSAATNRDSVVKRAIETHRPELEAVRSAAAELALGETINRGFEQMLYREHVKTTECIGFMLDKVATTAPYVSDAVLEDMLARFVQVTTAIVYTSKSTVAAYVANPAKDLLDAETLKRVQGAFNALAASPAKVPDPADLFVSDRELKQAAGVEGGLSEREAPPRPNIPVTDIAEMAKAFAQGLSAFPAR